MITRGRAAVLGSVASALLAVAVPAVAAERAVAIVDDDFDPKGMDADPADTLIWTNTGSVDHSVTSDDGLFDSGALAPGETFTLATMPPGTVRYHCVFHGGPGGEGMSGVLFVGGGSTGGDDEPADEVADEVLASTGGGVLPPGAFAFFALTIVALGVYLSRVERLVYPERFD